MLDQLTSTNYRDFNQRYEKTYGWLHLKGTELFVFLKSINDKQVTFITSSESCDYHIKVNSGVLFEFIPVQRGWFRSTNGIPYYLQRVAARQWRRGIADTNTSVNTFIGYDLCPCETSLELFKSIFECDQSPRIADFNKDWSILNKYFCINKSNVYMFNEKIGVIRDNQINLTSDLFQQELSDALRQNKVNMEILVNV